jgi:asparagine synthase (glutamine-hydrolysing)
MCGIAGILSLDGRPVTAGEVQNMCSTLIHRGPDDGGVYVGRGVGLGMRRLSIIDLATGDQPVHNEDGSVWVVFNGEIYNFADLRADLIRRGHVFYTAGDTETIVHAYEEFGANFVDKLRGMFAIAIWDAERRQLIVARDRVGIKPLYWTEVNGRLLFASEVKSLLQHPEVARDINWGALDHLFSYLTTPPAESIVRGIRKLEPGHRLTASPEGSVRVERYWNVRFEPNHDRSEKWFVERLSELLDESVRLHLVSDVPVGAFLSGGIDSSTVVATMAQMMGRPVKTFSIGFSEPEYSELDSARIVAERFGTEHHELVLEPDVIGVVEELTWYLDEPFGDSSALPTYMVSKMAAEHVKVVLSGDGGDELFAGYDRYLMEQREREYTVPPAARRLLAAAGRVMPPGMRGRNFARHFALSGAQRYLDAGTMLRLDDRRRLFRPEVAELMKENDPSREALACLAGDDGGWLAKLQYFDLMRYLPLDILTKVDRMSMAHSLEARVPLLDHKLIEFAATIPESLRIRNGTTKYILKRAVANVLPQSLLDRPKKGFAIPLGIWFRGKLDDFVRDLLLSQRARQRGIFDPDAIERMLKMPARGRSLDLPLWTLISFELWCRTFLDSTTPMRAGGSLIDRGSIAVGVSA